MSPTFPNSSSGEESLLQAAERTIIQSQRQLQEISDFMPQLVWVTDGQGRNEFFNKGWYEYLGLDFDQSKDGGWLQVIHPDDLDRTIQTWTKAMEDGEYYEIEYRMRRVDGQFRWQLARAIPLRNELNQTVRWFGTCTDIHDQKTMSERLEQLVEERTRELQRSNEDLQQFAHVASHDLKEPVRKIKTFASRIEDEFAGQIPPLARTYLGKIQSAANRIYSMIEGVLKYSSVSGTMHLVEKVDLGRLLRDIQVDLEVPIQQKGAQLSVGPLPAVEGAAVLLYQLFYNIVNNSLKFSKSGISPCIDIAAQAGDGETVAITVSDNGIGFEQQFADRIFDTFSRLNPKDKYEGTGLGLALCKKIVLRHMGQITAEGRPGEGASFTITLPLKQDRQSL